MEFEVRALARSFESSPVRRIAKVCFRATQANVAEGHTKSTSRQTLQSVRCIVQVEVGWDAGDELLLQLPQCTRTRGGEGLSGTKPGTDLSCRRAPSQFAS